ncbi:kinesin light chain [Penicillium hordei]|uniref:Kinesin light chain n=1 Tax=Penicillium hordei TaxID=40994 RepID=A0AAD6GVP1_9EURO|nr:kinesin light chain [Penicillium hordei]KAJ5593551.1 kinesin light chain [Penicillium hordei]
MTLPTAIMWSHRSAKIWDHISIVDATQSLGILLRDQGTLNEAEQMFRWALAGYEKALGPEQL